MPPLHCPDTRKSADEQTAILNLIYPEQGRRAYLLTQEEKKALETALFDGIIDSLDSTLKSARAKLTGQYLMQLREQQTKRI